MNSMPGEAVKGRWLFLPIENKSREFDAKVFLAGMAAVRGYKVLLGDYGTFRKWLSCLPQGMLMEKSISVNKVKALRRYKSCGLKTSVMDEESFAIFKDPENWLQTRMSEETLGLVDCVFAWGERQAQMIRDYYPAHAEKVFATGTPRADLWRRELNKMYADAVADIQARFGRYILLPSNFSSVINVKGENFVIEQAEKYGYIDNDEDRRYLEGLIAHQRSNLLRFVAVLERIRKEIPGHAIIIRPHPTDDHEFWNQAVKGIVNAHVIYEGSPTPWLLGADAIFHHGCSTGVEARILGRCAVAFHPDWSDTFDTHPSTRIGPVAKDEDSLMGFIRQSVQDPDSCYLHNSEAEQYICSVEGKFASERILDIIDGIEWDEDAIDLSWGNLRAARVRSHEAWRKIRRSLNIFKYMRSDRHERSRQRSRQKWPGTSNEEICGYLAGLSGMIDVLSNVRSREIAPDLYCIAENGTDFSPNSNRVE